MPAITIAAGATGTIASRQFNNIPAYRKALVFSLISGDAYWGVDNTGTGAGTVTAAGATDAGIPMVIGTPVGLGGDHYDFSLPVKIFSPSGCVVNYQEILS